MVFLAYYKIKGDATELWLAGGLAAFAGGFSEPVFSKTVAQLTRQG